MGRNTVLPLVVLAGLLLLPAHAQASHYRLPSSGLVTKVEAKAFAKVGLTSTKALLEAGLVPKQRAVLARKTSIKKARIVDLVRQCDLLRISGVGPSMVRLFQEAGFRDTRGLSRATPATVWKRVSASNSRLRLMPEAPAKELVSVWVSEAKRLPRIVKGMK